MVDENKSRRFSRRQLQSMTEPIKSSRILPTCCVVSTALSDPMRRDPGIQDLADDLARENGKRCGLVMQQQPSLKIMNAVDRAARSAGGSTPEVRAKYRHDALIRLLHEQDIKGYFVYLQPDTEAKTDDSLAVDNRDRRRNKGIWSFSTALPTAVSDGIDFMLRMKSDKGAIEPGSGTNENLN